MDAALLSGFRRGDRETLARVYAIHIEDVERAVRRSLARLQRLSAANVADVVQEVFLKAFSPASRASYDGVRPYGPFLLALTKNLVIDWARRGLREVLAPPGLDDIFDSPDLAVQDESPYPPELVTATAAYVAGLPPELRAVHERRFLLAEPQRAAAKALGMSRQTLRTLEKKLVDGLRKELVRARFDLRDLHFDPPSVPSGHVRS